MLGKPQAWGQRKLIAAKFGRFMPKACAFA